MKKKDGIKVCLVGSSGGHLTHLYMLKPFWKDKNRFWVTFDKEDARSLLEGEKVYPCYFPTNRSIKALIKNTKIAWDVLHKEKPDLIISCGAAVAVPFFYMGKMMGAKLMCDKSNLPEYVEYYQDPSKEQLVELYNISNYFIFPSLEEGWGLTPIEAMACGCIVFGTNTGFVQDLGAHRENMMISKPGDINEMVDNIEDVLSDYALAEKIKKGAVRTMYNLKWEKSAKKLCNLLMEM